ncbi:MAG: hypothetical protein WCD18_15870 [Thermosynechococcaceae cyanobacterium]
MKKLGLGAFAFCLIASLWASVLPAQASWQTSDSLQLAGWWKRQNNVQYLLDRLATDADIFQRSYDHALDISRLDGTQREDNFNEKVKDFRDAARDLRDDYRDGGRRTARIRNLLIRGQELHGLLERSPRQYEWQDEWQAVRRDLRDLDNATGNQIYY